MPRLSLQTLVENSVKYAVSPARAGASISVRAQATDGRLRVAVEDDGPGFDASYLPEGHGLRLLKARLGLTFGDRARIAAESRPGRTTVTLDLPGVAREDLSVNIEGSIVRIETKAEARRQFKAAYELPQDIDTEASGAQLENGVLSLTLAKKVPVSNARALEVK